MTVALVQKLIIFCNICSLTIRSRMDYATTGLQMYSSATFEIFPEQLKFLRFQLSRSTLSLSLSLVLSFFLSLSLVLSFFLSFSLSLSFYLSFSLSLVLSFFLSLSRSLFLSLSLFFLSLSLSLYNISSFQVFNETTTIEMRPLPSMLNSFKAMLRK